MHSVLAAWLVLAVPGDAAAPVAALRSPGPLSPRNASYRIEASLEPATKTVRGHLHLTWRNPTAGAAKELVLHLYMNAFRNESSIFFKESHGRHRSSTFAGKHSWGAIDVTRLSVDGGADVAKQLVVDDTLATLPLARAVPGGGTVELDVDFVTRLPKVFARTGWADDFFAVAQWFPKVAVFDCDPACRWRADQLHLNSEFFADFGNYDVQVDVPEGWKIGATGRSGRVWTEKARTFVLFHAEDVTDFAWFTSPKFIDLSDEYRDELGAVVLRLLVWPGHEASARRHFAATKIGLAELARRYGPYPYSQVTLIDVPDDAEGAGGMEYPTLFTTGSFPLPDGLHLAELITIHELSHQYTQGIVSSDEAEEAWLDEGLTETMTDWGLSRMFGRERALYDFFGHRLSYTDAAHLSYRRVAGIDPPETPSFAFLDNGSYGAITYAKTDLILRTAESLIGADKLEAGLRHYYDRAKFTHPKRADFVRLVDAGIGETTGVDLSRFWHETLETADQLDYEVLQVSADPIHPPAGLIRDAKGEEREVSPSPQPDGPWRSEVVVHRKGEIALPVDVRVVFDDGSERRERWDDDGAGPRWHRWEYETKKPVRLAEVDPEHRLVLDVKRLNDGRRREPDSGPRRRILATARRWLSIVLGAVGF